mgnify:CR=1 FL=1
MGDFSELVSRQKAFVQGGATRSPSWRKQQLEKLLAEMDTQEDRILDALKQDLNKAPFEAFAAEVGMVRAELKHSIRHLHRWTKQRRVSTPLAHFPSRSFVTAEPYGSVLILSPWNYPFQLCMAPLIAALAAGNCVVTKPSSQVPATSAVISDLLAACFPPEYAEGLQGPTSVANALLDEPFDYIFFTGSPGVGRMVMEKASKHLTPVTLELGGKSPCIVTPDADISLAARRIAWGKTINAGQTCVAPDYLVVHRSVYKPLTEELARSLRELWGEAPHHNPDYTRIIGKRHFDQLAALKKQAQPFYGGEENPETLQIAPALIEAGWDDPIMEDEIFGPLLPIIPYEDLNETLQKIQERPKPLALYLFTTSRGTEKKVLGTVSFGGGCVNDTVVHLANPELPFGGVGQSGMGSYHGKAGFDTFTHYKGILKKHAHIDVPLRYPPYKRGLGLLKRFF